MAWLGIIIKLPPYHSNLSKRLIKSPKIYFADVSLASRLSGWSEIEPLMVSPQAGALFENIILQELLRNSDNHQLNWRISFFRTRDGEEIDFVVENGAQQEVLVECKLGGGDPLRIKSGEEPQRIMGACPLVIVGITTSDKTWKHNVYTSALPTIALFIEKFFKMGQ